MDIVFKMHNELGRHLDEKIYERELAFRLGGAGIHAQMQVPLGLQFEDYSTTLFVDLLVEGSTIYELKAGSALAPAHRAQALSYLFLADTRHGKLVNLGTPRVEHEFVSTSLSFDDRRQFEIVDREWIASGNAGRLREFIIALARDWGVFSNALFIATQLCIVLGASRRFICRSNCIMKAEVWAHRRWI